MKFNAETVYDLAAKSAHAIVGELYADRGGNVSEDVYKKLLNDPMAFSAIPTLSGVCQLLKLAGEEIGNDQAGKAAPALRRLVKNTRHEERMGVFQDEQGRQIACDGFRAVRLNTPIKGVPEVKPFFSYEQTIGSYRKGDRKYLHTPKLGDIRKEISHQRAIGKEPLWDFGPELPTVNAVYLHSMLEILPDSSLYICGEIRKSPSGNLISNAISFDSPSGDGLLLPCNKRQA